MENGTDTWVIVVAAFGGGIAGAILQPTLAYSMDLLRGKGQRRKAIERNLRRMLTVWLGFTTKAAMMAMEIAGRRDFGRPTLSEVEILQRIRMAEQHFPTWQIERIHDAQLEGLADKLYSIALVLPLRLIDPNTTTTWLNDVAGEIGQLRRNIVIRMDELDWPEFEGQT